MFGQEMVVLVYVCLYQFIEGQAHVGKPRGAIMSLAHSEPK